MGKTWLGKWSLEWFQLSLYAPLWKTCKGPGTYAKN